MPAEVKKEIQLEIAHVLFTDIVGYSKLSINEQNAAVDKLTQIVRGMEQFQKADSSERLIKISTGDGMALVFYTSPEAPARCAMELSRALKDHPRLRLRMGIHSGPVSGVIDVTGRTNLAGAGINTAQRVMSCGDAGHILLSRHVAEDLEEYDEWRPLLHELGEFEAKHGVRISVANLYSEEFGNPAVPEKLKAARVAAVARRKRTTFRWLSLGALTLLAAVAAIGFLFVRYAPRFAATALAIPEKSIAVLPFENLSADKENAYFTDGVQNEILTDLAKIADLKVISRTSVMLYKSGNPRNLREIGQQLGVAHILEGSVQRSAGKVRVSAELIDARTDKHLWAQSYDRALADVFAIETEVAQAIANELQAKLSASEKASIEEKPTQDLVAYDFYIRAVSMIYTHQVPSQEDLVNLSDAVDLLNKAVARDPNFFLAYCQLAFVHDLAYEDEIDHTPARLALAKSAIDSAFQLRPYSGDAHLALGWHLYWGYHDYDRARAELALAQQSLPNNPVVYELAGLIDRRQALDRRQAHWADATQNLERACELDPRNLPYLITLGATYLSLQDYEQYAKVLDRIIALHPERKPPRLFRAFIEVDRRADTGPFRAAIEKILTNEPGSEKDPFLTSQRYILALYERDFDAAGRAAPMLSQKNSLQLGVQLGRDFWVGVVARLKRDETSARAAFMKARAQQEEEIRGRPDNITLLSELGLIDAALGRKEEALNEGRRAMELLPILKDLLTEAYAETYVKTCFAMICAWTGERELALQQLEALTKIPGGPTYGDLRLNPMWDPLRGAPRFEKIVEESKNPIALK